MRWRKLKPETSWTRELLSICLYGHAFI